MGLSVDWPYPIRIIILQKSREIPSYYSLRSFDPCKSLLYVFLDEINIRSNDKIIRVSSESDADSYLSGPSLGPTDTVPLFVRPSLKKRLSPFYTRVRTFSVLGGSFR